MGMSLAGLELAHVIYRSPTVTLCEFTYQAPYGSPEHRFDCDTIVFIRSGIFTIRVSEREALVDANYVVFGSEGDALVAMRGSKSTCTCTALRYSDRAQPFSRKVSLCAPSVYLAHARLVNAVRLARDGSEIDRAASRIVSAERSALPATPACEGQHARTVREIRALMNQSLSKPLSLFDLANRFYVSPFTVSRWFHAETGLPMRLYMQRLRLRRALTYILDEKRSLTAIAIELGFYDEPHFSKAFHAEFGIPPALALTTS
jgi:AraC-like DNA-binding protein